MGHKLPRIPRKCLECDVEFMALPWEVARGNALYCCASHARSATQRKGLTVASAVCKHCAKTFFYIPGKKGKFGHQGKFCSKKCTSNYHAVIRSASVGPFDSHGKPRVDSKKDRDLFSAIIKDAGKCADCGATKNLHAHHILERHKRPDLRWEPTNIQVLCAPCHATRHPNIAAWILSRSVPKPPKPAKSCAECGSPLSHKRKTAIWCSRKCQAGRKRSPSPPKETAIRIAGPKRGAARCKAVRCLTYDTFHESISAAADAYGISYSPVSKVCSGKEDSASGLVFRYAA